MNRRAAVFGATGQLGVELVRELKARQYGVTGWDRQQVDITDASAVEKALTQFDAQVVFNAAAYNQVDVAEKEPQAAFLVNALAVRNLALVCRQMDARLVQFSTDYVFDGHHRHPYAEDDPPHPLSAYAVSKLAGELYMQSFQRVYGMETVVIRYFNVFGPFQDPTSHYSGILAIFTMKMLAGEIPTIYGDGEQSRDFTFIQNVVHGNLLASEAPAERVSGKVFNIATGSRVTLNQTVEILRRATGYTGEVRYAAERSGDVKHSLADISRAKECFGYEPLVGFNEGIERTVAWYKAAAETANVHTGSRQ